MIQERAAAVTADRPSKPARRVAINAVRLVGFVVFAYFGFVLGSSALGATTPTFTPHGPLGPYPMTVAIGVLGVLLDLGLWVRMGRATSLVETLGWLLGGVVVMAAVLWLSIATDPAFAPGGTCSFQSPIQVTCEAFASPNAT